MSPPLPESTYRLQFHAGFTFRDAAAIVPYLHDLGVTHVYASPYLKARPGSTHGYDVIDHCSLNPELGTRADYAAFCDALAQHGMSHILDTVPNHVGVGTNDNVWWNDVLEHGQSSKYAKYFDITWRHGKLVLPLLGAPREEVIAKGELKLVDEDGKRWLRYYDRRFPVSGAAGDIKDVIAAQHYVLAYWRDASETVNYRRFFDINDLAALAQEHEEVFEATHRFTFELIEQGRVTGLRIDHPDGLYDPEQYLRRLQRKRPGLYVVVEKILAPDEPLPTTWPCHGTSGYDFLNMVNGLFLDTRNEAAFTKLYQEWTGGGNYTSFEDLVYTKKKLILETSLAGELLSLAQRMNANPEALRELIACFPVYRTYITARGVSETDAARINETVQRAALRNPQSEPAIRAVADAVLSNPDFAGKFQQLTAPVMAKGVEDTAFYVYNRFVSLNEVGGEPSHFGVTPEKLHAYFADRQRHWPHAMSALSTHDTKRSEDVRARLNVLSEIPDEWAARVKRWRELNARHKGNDGGAPDANEEYLIYQTLLGAWPLEPWTAQEYDAFVGRVQAYIVKAMREAKVNTTWTDQNAAHETAVTDFIAALLDESRGGEFLADLRPFRQRVSRLGLINSLAQTVLRLTAPGVPDTYQGQELWDFSLVDPDNRRPVDYAKRRDMLSGLDATPRELMASMEDGRVKLWLTTRLLTLRRAHPGLFSQGEYVPLRAQGPRADHLFAFERRHEGMTATVIVPRLVHEVEGPAFWSGTRLEPGGASGARNMFTERPFSENVADLLAEFPVAVIVRDR